MNLHPIFVHFPIALLTIYAILELIRLKSVTNRPYFFYLKATFAILGFVSAKAAIFSGLAIEDNFRGEIVETHEKLAFLSLFVFGIIALAYIVEFLEREGIILWLQNKFNGKLGWLFWIEKFISKISNPAIEKGYIILPAIIGLILVSLTGALGGIMVYGASSDPFTRIVYQIFFGTR